MNLELLMLSDQPVAQLVERARLAEACGFDAVWVADERFYSGGLFGSVADCERHPADPTWALRH